MNEKNKVVSILKRVRDFVETDPRYNPVPEQGKPHQYCVGEALRAVEVFGDIPADGSHVPKFYTMLHPPLANRIARSVANEEFGPEFHEDIEVRGRMDKGTVLRMLDRTIELVKAA